MSVDVTGAIANVTGAIRQAAQRTGANFHYLLATARIESNLNPAARASSSSASGLFQFLEQTWLGMVKHAGPALGYGRFADAIMVNAAGRYEVNDPRLRQQILDLRYDPTANALMAGAFTQWNETWLAAKLGRAPSGGELYLAHFLGPAGAARLISLAASSPHMSAAEAFPSAAGANRAIFYNKQGAPRTVAQVYDLLVDRYAASLARNPRGPEPGAVAGTAATPLPGTPPPVPLSSPALLTMSLNAPPPAPPVKESGPVFHHLFHTSDRREPIAPLVNALWGGPPSSPAQTEDAGRPPALDLLQLFRDKG